MSHFGIIEIGDKRNRKYTKDFLENLQFRQVFNDQDRRLWLSAGLERRASKDFQ